MIKDSLGQLIKTVKNHHLNFPGWKTDRKIVIIESDDWGAIRSPDKDNHRTLVNYLGGNIDNPYLKYDTLASEDDLNKLFNLLTEFKDKNGSHPVITFNTIMANPDFDRIKESDFQEYHFEPFHITLSRYSQHTDSFSIWKTAMDEGLMKPQLHGREHVNVDLWLSLLQNGNKDIKKAFELMTWSIPHDRLSSKIKLQAALDYERNFPKDFHQKYLKDAVDLFYQTFGFNAATYIPTNFIMDPDLVSHMRKLNIKGIQGMKYLPYPYGSKQGRKRILERRITGYDKKYQLIQLVRNAEFEPSQRKPGHDSVSYCLSAISNAFFHKKPAIISAHRLNFIGYLDPVNRDRNLRSFRRLLSSIVRKWPDAEFMSSDRLLSHMMN